jgi:MFS family permease
MTAAAFARLLIPDVRGLPRAFWLLFAAALIDRVGGFAHAYLAIYLTSGGGVSLGAAGLLISLMSLGGVVGSPLGGALADRLGRKPMLVGGLLLTAASWLHVGASRSVEHIGAAVFLAGLASSLARPAMVAAIADVVPEGDRRRAFGLHYWAINLGFACAASLAGLLASTSWSLVFTLDAMTSILAAGVLFVAMRHVRAAPGGTEAPARMSLVDVLRGPLRDGIFMLLVLQGFTEAAMFMQAHVGLAAEMRADGLVAQYGPLLAINGVLIVLLQPSVTQLSARLRSTVVLGAGSLLVGLGFFLTAFSDAWFEHAAAIAVWTLGEILLASTMPAVISRLAPPHRRATYQGLFQMSWPAAAFAPAAGAFVLEHAGSLALWGGCLFLGVAGALIQVRLHRSPRMRSVDG